MSLESAPEEVKLAVDLIMLLEENQIPARLVLKALEIVRQDYIAKRDIEEKGMTPGT
ncbi:pleiotropic regulatory protein RsmS [Tatumella citrea]|nr:pleiotropic regulatory protein RsmS [Tatumella citrea]